LLMQTLSGSLWPIKPWRTLLETPTITPTMS